MKSCNPPLVSVIVPAYNASNFIEKTLNSILAQTYSNFEVLVIDDGSQDMTADIVIKMAEKDSRIRLLQQVNSGVSAARNLGIEKAKGEFIAPIDSDDLWHPENLAKQIECFLNSPPSVGLTYAWSVDIDENDMIGKEFRAPNIERNVYTILLLHDFIASASSTVIRRSVLDRVGGYRSHIKLPNLKENKTTNNCLFCEDWEMYLRISEYYEFRAIPEFLIGYRKLPSSRSSDGQGMAESKLEIWQEVLDKYPLVPKSIYSLSMSSFYMYLARQSSRCGKHQKTLFWLYKALKANWITPFLRLGLYTLSLKSCFYLIANRLKGKLEHDSSQKLNQIDRANSESIKFTNMPMLANKKGGIKSWMEKILAKIIPLMFGTPNQWRKIEG